MIQLSAVEDMRGRVMAFYTVAFFGTVPIGSLIAGSMAERMGAPATLMFSGALCVLASVWYFGRLPSIRRVLRPVYIEQGIIQDSAEVLDVEGR